AKVLNIELHYLHLPPYSPNLNPIERLWKVMNEYVRNNIYFSSKVEYLIYNKPVYHPFSFLF
ncbi:hypothetical protein G4170_22495, partial [Vibrio parahaemolyticus]